jgi:hypothetical protein
MSYRAPLIVTTKSGNFAGKQRRTGAMPTGLGSRRLSVAHLTAAVEGGAVMTVQQIFQARLSGDLGFPLLLSGSCRAANLRAALLRRQLLRRVSDDGPPVVAARTWAVVGKPPGKEPACGWALAMPRILWGFVRRRRDS